MNTTTTVSLDHAAELRRAISETRIVFESEPAAGDALNYLESVLVSAATATQLSVLAQRVSLFEAAKDLLQWIEAKHRPPAHDHCGTMALVRLDALATLADAVVDEETRRSAAGAGLPADYVDLIVTSGRIDAGITKETPAGAGAEQAAGAAQQAASSTASDQAAADTATIIAKLALDIDTSAITVALAMIEQLSQAVAGLSELDGLCASITDSLSATTSCADQAAAAMAAESAQLVADAEKAAAAAAARAAVDPLAVLSREVFSLAEKFQQPADLVVQLMVLAELRALPRLDV